VAFPNVGRYVKRKKTTEPVADGDGLMEGSSGGPDFSVKKNQYFATCLTKPHKVMANVFKRDVGAQVSKADALKWIDKFDKERKKDTKSVFYGRDALLRILKDPTVAGISFFFCRKTEASGKEYDDLVLVGTKEDGTLVWKDKPPVQNSALTSNASATEGGMDGDGSDTYENSYPCPPFCPTL
jgi:hypothetical protein